MSRKAAWILVAVLAAAVLVPQVVYAATGAFSSSSSSTALSATNSGSGRAINATSKTGYAGVFTRSATSGSTATLYAIQKSASNGASALFGYSTSTGSGSTYGVYGRDAASNGRGVFGYATRSSGVTYGVYGRSLSTTDGATGVFGFASGSTGDTCGVCGDTSSDLGIGVGGFAPGLGVLGSGVLGVLGDSSGIGDGSLGLASATDAGFAGHVFGSAADGLGHYDFAGTCTVAGMASTADCVFKHSFPSGTTPIIVVTPTSNPGAIVYWVGAPGAGTAQDAFSINTSPAIGASPLTFNYMVVGLNTNVVPASIARASRAASAVQAAWARSR